MTSSEALSLEIARAPDVLVFRTRQTFPNVPYRGEVWKVRVLCDQLDLREARSLFLERLRSQAIFLTLVLVRLAHQAAAARALWTFSLVMQESLPVWGLSESLRLYKLA